MIASGLSVVMLAISLLLCAATGDSSVKMGIQKKPFGKTTDGLAADLYVLANRTGMQVSITNYGATVVSVEVPDRASNVRDVVLGYDTVSGYQNGKSYFGATVGRYANRIARGQFQLDGKTYVLPKNDGENTLHGGILGFNKRLWTVKEISDKDSLALEFSYVSRDGEEGFPGNLTTKILFELPNEKNELWISYSAETDKATVLNLTNHSYFNLAGEGDDTILFHDLSIYGRKFTPVDSTLIPTGELREVKNGPFDFTQGVRIGARIEDPDQQLKFGKGYDHNWELEKRGKPDSLELAARVTEPKSGRILEVLTTEPGLQFYSGNFLDGTERGKGNKSYAHRSALCLETQHFPDSPNHSNFPPIILDPGKKYSSTTVLRFSAK